MIVAAAVIPAAPMLIPGLAGAAEHEIAPLRRAAVTATRTVLADVADATTADESAWRSVDAVGAVGAGEGRSGGPAGSMPIPGAQLLVIGPTSPGSGAGEAFDLAGQLDCTDFGPLVTSTALRTDRDGRGSGVDRPERRRPIQVREVPTSLLVARVLLGLARPSRQLAGHAVPLPGQRCAGPSSSPVVQSSLDVLATACWSAVGPGQTWPVADCPEPTGLIVIADLASCYGPKAPRAEDERAAGYDDAVVAALRSGVPAQVARLDPELGSALGASGAHVWPLWATAMAGRSWRGEIAWHGAPYGVGYVVSTWRR